MFNPIEAKRRFVQAQIQKSFDSGINVSEETDIEKATYVDNSENRKLGRVGQQYGGTKEPKNKPTTQLSMTIDAIDDFIEASEKFSKMKPTDNGYAEQKKKLLGFAKLADETGDRLTTAELKELKNNHPKHAETLKTIFKMSAAIKAECDELEKAHKDGDHHPTKPWVWVSSANGGKGDWRVEGGRSNKKAGASTTPAPRKPGSTDEIERMTAQGVRSSILGLNNIATNVKDNGDHFKIDFDVNDFTTHGQRSPQIDRIAKFLESMGASCVIGKCSIKAYKKVEKKDVRKQTDIPLTPQNTEEYAKRISKVLEPKGYYVRSMLSGSIEIYKKGDRAALKNLKASVQSTQRIEWGPNGHLKSTLEPIILDAMKGEKKEQQNTNVSIDSEIKSQYSLSSAAELAEEEYQKTTNKKIAKILGGSVSDLYTIDDEDGTYIDDSNWNTLLNDKPKSIGKTIDLGSGKEDGDDFWYGEGELVTTKGGNKIFCWHDSGGFAVNYVIKENKSSKPQSDPRNKIAHDAGFKDYEEMKGYQDYVTQKNLLKKKSTKAGMRLLYEQEVAKYEKDHADLIKKLGNKTAHSNV